MTAVTLARTTWGFSPHVRVTVFNAYRAYCVEDIVDGPAYHYVGGVVAGTSVPSARAWSILPGPCPAGAGTPR